MIFYFSKGLNPLTTNPESVHQGSEEANALKFIAPYPSNFIVTVSFICADGYVLAEQYMTPYGQINGVQDNDGDLFAMWAINVPARATAYSGRLTIQFRMETATGSVIASTSTVVNILKGVPKVLPAEPEDFESVYESIYQAFSQMAGLIFDTVGSTELIYSVDEFTRQAAVTGFTANNSLTVLKIPPYYLYQGEYYPVTSINASLDFPAVTEVSLPDTLTGITVAAFSGCHALRKIKIPASVLSVANGTFKSNNGSTSDGIQSITLLGAPPTNLKNIVYTTEETANNVTLLVPAQYQANYASAVESMGDNNTHYTINVFAHFDGNKVIADIAELRQINGDVEMNGDVTVNGTVYSTDYERAFTSNNGNFTSNTGDFISQYGKGEFHNLQVKKRYEGDPNGNAEIDGDLTVQNRDILDEIDSKQDTISDVSKLSSDLVDDANKTNRFVKYKNNPDFNDLTATGIYICDCESIGGANRPNITGSFKAALAVESLGSSIVQVLSSSYHIYLRYYAGGAWTSWTDYNLAAFATQTWVVNNTLPASTKYGKGVSLSFNSTNGTLTVQLKDQDGNNLGTSASVQIDLTTLENAIEAIEALIPSQASTSNQLADKAFVNSSIATNTANFLGTYNIVTDLGLSTSATDSAIATAIAAKMTSEGFTVTNNDYVYVAYPNSITPSQYDRYDRWKYSSADGWGYEFTLNNSSFTAEQWAAINSGITAANVTAYNAHLVNESNPHNVTKAQVGLGNVDNTSDTDKPVSTPQAEAIKQGQSVFNVSSIETIYDSYASLPSDYDASKNGTVLICVNTSFTSENIDENSLALASVADWNKGFLVTYLYDNDTSTGTWSEYSVLKPHTIYIDISTGRLYRYTMSGDHIVSIQPYLPTTATEQNQLVVESQLSNYVLSGTLSSDFFENLY